MWAIFFNKLKNNRSLIFLYLIVFIPVITMVFFLMSDYNYREKEEIRKNEQMAQVLAESLDSYIENIKATLSSLSTLPSVQSKDRQEIERIFRSIMLVDNQISLYWATDTDGHVIAKYPNYWEDKKDESFIKEILKKPVVITDPRKGTITGMEIITVSTLIKGPKGKILGAIGASVPLENLQKKLLLKVGSKGYPILVTKTGNFLVHPEREQISKKIKINDPIFQTILKGGSGTIDTVAPYDQKRKFFSYVPLKQADWVVIVIQPLSEFNEQTLRFLTRNGVIILLVITLVVLGTYYLILFQKREEENRMVQTEKLSIVGQLAAGMAHEIRNPLASIKGFAQISMERKDFIHEYLEIIVEEVNRIEGIIKETLLLAKPSPVKFKPTDIRQVLEEVNALMEPQMSLRNISFEFHSAEKLPLIMGDSNQLKQVFINLVKNSIEAMCKSDDKISVFVEVFEGYIIVTIQDNGCGVPPEIMKKMGSPFLTTKETGTGLGLMVTYRIIQNHNGIIEVESNIGEGTAFKIKLPTPSV